MNSCHLRVQFESNEIIYVKTRTQVFSFFAQSLRARHTTNRPKVFFIENTWSNAPTTNPLGKRYFFFFTTYRVFFTSRTRKFNRTKRAKTARAAENPIRENRWDFFQSRQKYLDDPFPGPARTRSRTHRIVQ